MVIRIHDSWETSDRDEAMEAFRSAYRGVRVASSDETRFALRTTSDGDEELAFTTLSCQTGGSATSDKETFYTVAEFDSPLEFISGRDPLDTRAPMLVPRARATARWEDSHRLEAVRVEQTMLDAFARDYFAAPYLTVTFTGTRALNRARAAQWVSLRRHVIEHVLPVPDLFENDIVWAETRRFVAAMLLTTFPNNTLDLAPAHDGSTALPSTLRRAIAYMEACVAEPITVAEIAAAARLSPRGLQEAFQRELGTTPLRYLRTLRMEGARSDLASGDPATGDTVEATAHAWGFSHIPRFAAQYRELFGENPSATLRR